jgi:hypothetical protein
MKNKINPNNVVTRFEKRAMAVILRNVVNHNWGFFSDEDQRMHLQTVDLESLKGPNKIKIWLEEKGHRICKLALGTLSGPDLKKLQNKIENDREVIEVKWVHFMINNDWVEAKLNGSIVTLIAYPKSHNRYERTIDLRKRFSGSYKGFNNWDEEPPKLDFDRTNGFLAIGTEKNLDDRDHILVADYLFYD